jgi:hypothetical protein
MRKIFPCNLSQHKLFSYEIILHENLFSLLPSEAERVRMAAEFHIQGVPLSGVKCTDRR